MLLETCGQQLRPATAAARKGRWRTRPRALVPPPAGEAAPLQTEDVPACAAPIFAATATHSALMPHGHTLSPEALTAAARGPGARGGEGLPHGTSLVFEV